MTIPEWQSRKEWEIWWAAHVVAFNRLSVSDPREWERVAKAIEKFNQENPR